MSEVLGNKNFKTFYRLISDDASSSEKCLESLKEALLLVAEPLKIGCLELFINSPANSINVNGMQERITLYMNPSGYEPAKGVRETFVTNEFGIIQLQVYPVLQYEWDEEGEDEIDFIIRLIYDSVLRTQLQLFLLQASITDPVTGACNQAGVMEQLKELKTKDKLSLYDGIYFNIKNYYYINSRVGHEQSYKALRSFSVMIREYLNKGEVFGRIGGSNFFLLVERERTKDVIKYLSSRRIPINIDGKSIEFDFMVRAGVYSIHPADVPDKVMSSSKAAFDYTKNPSAGDVIWFSKHMLDENVKDQDISNSFRKALSNREFEVYYQPKIDLKTTKLTSAEALCRWIKDGNVVPPMDFIPTLEKEGTIGDLDFYVLNMVCEHIKGWIAKGINPVRISVNFSRANILNKKLAEKILKVIRTHGVETKYLEIEITEVSGYEDFELLSEFVNIMHENGVETSIDDFGTGYSSLNLIKDLNVDTIKLDKTFLERISNDADEKQQDKSVVKNIINMVNELNMKVVAEGVETSAQMEFLRQVNCQQAQGFLFDKPLPKDKFEFRLLGERTY